MMFSSQRDTHTHRQTDRQTDRDTWSSGLRVRTWWCRQVPCVSCQLVLTTSVDRPESRGSATLHQTPVNTHVYDDHIHSHITGLLLLLT